MNRLDHTHQVQVVRCLVEGNSIRSAARLTGVAKNTVVKLLVVLGAACTRFMDGEMRNLPCRRLQVNEVWSFPGTNQGNMRPRRVEARECAGDIWAWTAVDTDTKLVPRWMLGTRDANVARGFIEDLAGRVASRIELNVDGLKVCLAAADRGFDTDTDYAQLVKIYGNAAGSGGPGPEHIDPSFAVRANLSMRTPTGWLSGLSNGFRRKLENHSAALAFYFIWYNFGRVHQTLKTTPAVKAGLADHVWSLGEILALLGGQSD
jgi:hypothetical protein